MMCSVGVVYVYCFLLCMLYCLLDCACNYVIFVFGGVELSV